MSSLKVKAEVIKNLEKKEWNEENNAKDFLVRSENLDTRVCERDQYLDANSSVVLRDHFG